jgi:hypothetical protein
MTAKRSLKRLVRSRMRATGETYTAALAAVRGPDPRPTERQGEPAMTSASTPDPETPVRESDGTAVPILPARDISQIVAFFNQLGFGTEIYEDGEYAFVRRRGIELQYTYAPDIDPFSAGGMAFIGVTDAQSMHDEFAAAGLWQVPPRGNPELAAELHSRWAAGESIARLSDVEDKPWQRVARHVSGTGSRQEPDSAGTRGTPSHPCLPR